MPVRRRGVPTLSLTLLFETVIGLTPVKRFVVILGVVLLVLGVVGLVHPTFNYHQQEEVAKLGPITTTVDQRKTAQVPPLISIMLLVAGIGLVLLAPRVKQ